jgi:hypothetical protein
MRLHAEIANCRLTLLNPAFGDSCNLRSAHISETAARLWQCILGKPSPSHLYRFMSFEIRHER